jgi:CRISPR/Cas system-associated exonuclease Cas4 (RecB family)
MPFAYFICEVTGENVDPQTCLSCSRDGGLPGCEFTPAIIAGIINNQRAPGFAMDEANKHYKGKVDVALSVTEALHCARKVHLSELYNWGATPSDQYYAFRGTAFHSMAEAYVDEDPVAIAEQRLQWTFQMRNKVISLTGAPDLITYRQDLCGWLIQDYKTIKEIPKRTYRYVCKQTGAIVYDTPWRHKGQTVKCPHCQVKHPNDDEHITIMELGPQARSSHVEQLQLYSLIIEQNIHLLMKIINKRMGEAYLTAELPVVAAELCYLDMGGVKRIPVPIWSRKKRIELLSNKIRPHTSEGAPDVLTDPSCLWECDYCPVRQQCEIDHGGKVGKAALDKIIEANEAVPD